MCLSVTGPLAALSRSVLLSPRRGCEAASQAAIAVITVQLIVAPSTLAHVIRGWGERGRSRLARSILRVTLVLARGGFQCRERGAWEPGGGEWGRMMRGRRALSVIRVPVSVFSGS